MRKAFYFLRLPVRLALSVIFIMSVASAGARDVEQARQAALQQMKAHAAKKANGRGGTAMAVDPQLVFSKAKSGDEAYYYVFTAGENLGYTVVSGDDRLPAIVGYTESGGFDAQRMPDGLAAFMQQYQSFVDNATDEQIAGAMAFKAAAKHAKVDPFMEEKWNQGEPYNNMCPYYAPGERAVTGCVATAVAQILHYYKCPVKLQDDIPAYTTFSYGLSMSAISADVQEDYDWANMLNAYVGFETDAQNNAVARLMQHVGCSVVMDYGEESGANAYPETFTKYFGMDKETVRLLDRENYDISQWDNILYGEMKAKRPVYYCGQSTKSGHAFVIHGYDDGLFYVNWGWGGRCDGYYDITLLNPYGGRGIGGGTSRDGYSCDNEMIIGIQPDNGVVDEAQAPYMIATGVSNSGIYVSENTIVGKVRCYMRNVNLTGKTNISVGYLGGDGKYVSIGTPEEIDSESYSQGVPFRRDVKNISLAYEEGKKYELCVIESKDKVSWIPCLKWGVSASFIVEVNGGELAVTSPESKLVATVELDEEYDGYASFENKINVTVTNSGNLEYYNKVYVNIKAPGAGDYKGVYVTGITAPVDGSTTFSFDYTPSVGGDHAVQVVDKEYNILYDGKLTFKDAPAEAPYLVFESIRCTNASDNKVYADYNDYDWNEEMMKTYQVEMKQVKDTKAEFEFVVVNYGGYYSGPFAVYEYDKDRGTFSGTDKTLKFNEYGKTKFTFTVEGKAGDVAGIMLISLNDYVDISGLSPENKNIHAVKDADFNFLFDCGEIVYLAGSNPDGITSTVADGADDNGAIYNLRGEKVTAPGKGIYIRNGKKFVIK